MVRTRELRPRGADLFDLHSTVAVHNLSCCLCFVARTRGENHDSSAPYPSDIIFRVRFEDPERREITNQSHFKIRVWSTHESATRHLPRLDQNTDVIPREASGLEIANDLVDRTWILKQTNCRFCHIDLHHLIVNSPGNARSIVIFCYVANGLPSVVV